MAFELTSTAFEPGGSIPRRHTCDGEDLSPALAWKEAPAATKSFALVCDDPDAPAGTWVHWVLYGVPATVRALPEGVKPTPALEDGSRQGRNDFRKIGYGGPCPPRGAAHRYFFKLYAVDRSVDLAPGATKAELLKAIDGHTLGQAELIGRYARQ
jgi:Raf kinase inhibitor-like YbhB/YbcL family protein